MKIAYLASQLTLPQHQRKPSDAIEHDQIMSLLRSAAESASSTIDDVAWDDQATNWGNYNAVIIGTAWDYCDRCDEFLGALNDINAQTPVFNSPDLVAWNSHKHYLRELEAKGLPIIPTEWIDQVPCQADWSELFARFDTERLVIKRQIGANAEGQFILKSGDTAPTLTQPMMVQPFLASVADEGEYSFIFVDGELSHALLKRPKSGDYRIQSSYGGTESAITAATQDLENAKSVIEVLEEVSGEIPLYARVDMVRGNSSKLLLMELELIEPFLYPLQGPNLGTHLMQALKKRL